MCRSIVSLSKITHQMWDDNSFTQRNKATKRAGIGVLGCVRLEAEVGHNLRKRESRQYRESLYKIGVLGTL